MAVAAIRWVTVGKKQGREAWDGHTRLFYVILFQRNPHPNRSDNFPS
jgi:hypothetical protein